MFVRTLIIGSCCLAAALAHADGPGSLSLVVMDPLAAPLSCPCVEGYAHRDYQPLAEHLAEALGQPVTITFAESLESALTKDSCPRVDLVIGKDSVVRADVMKLNLSATALGRLTDRKGKKTQTGLLVVRSADSAKALADLAGYRILFGPPECAEKFAAPRALLAEAGITIPEPEQSEVAGACSDGACKILEWGDTEQAVTVISSYAAPLLEGCGTIAPGDLRVIGETAPLPFITAFATNNLSEERAEKTRAALLVVGRKPELLLALESLFGFVALDELYREAYESEPAQKVSKSFGVKEARPTRGEVTSPADNVAWPCFRGPTRDGQVAWLPQTLPKSPEVLWRVPLARPGLGGIAVADGLAVVGDRDLSNNLDAWRCYDAATGAELWKLIYPALGQLDYDNCPRSTPLLARGKAYLLGAFGDLHCVEAETGTIVWATNLRRQFGGEHELVWGTCSSPVLVGENLIVNPGGPNASWVALNAETGVEVWRGEGDRHAYATPTLVTVGNAQQFVAYDRTSAGGWDPATGQRLWTLKPPLPGDFNVPSPLVVGDRLLLVTENNGARLHAFDAKGNLAYEPIATHRRTAPDMTSPILIGDRVLCVADRMFCLNASDLSEVWVGGRRDFPSFASRDRLLTIGRGGEMLLIDPLADKYRVVSRATVFDAIDGTTELLSQPAIVGDRLYARGENELVCVRLTSSF